MALPFVDQIWQIHGLIFVLQAASAVFTPATGGFVQRATGGLHICLHTPRLLGLLELTVTAAASAMVIVNTVVLAAGELGKSDAELALAYAAFGAGSIGAALFLPIVLARWADRPIVPAHPELPDEHPHLSGGGPHSHRIVIDEHHRRLSAQT